METANLNIKKAVQRIRLDDSPDSPVFTLDLTNSSINRKSVPMASAWKLYDDLVCQMGEGEMAPDLAKRVAAVYRHVVTIMLGPGSFETIKEYVTDGEELPDEEITDVLAPLVSYLFTRYGEVVTANRDRAVAKYLEAYEPHKG